MNGAWKNSFHSSGSRFICEPNFMIAVVFDLDRFQPLFNLVGSLG